MGGRRSSNQAKETVTLPVRTRKVAQDFVKQDGVMKEMVKKQEDLLETWTSRWDFLTNTREEWKKEAKKRSFDCKQWTSETEDGQTTGQFSPQLGRPPRVSSRMVGWRVYKDNNLDTIVGPLYESPKITMDPPPGPDEPDCRKHQHCFFLA